MPPKRSGKGGGGKGKAPDTPRPTPSTPKRTATNHNPDDLGNDPPSLKRKRTPYDPRSDPPRTPAPFSRLVGRRVVLLGTSSYLDDVMQHEDDIDLARENRARDNNREALDAPKKKKELRQILYFMHHEVPHEDIAILLGGRFISSFWAFGMPAPTQRV
ncbi:uncharacterized protein J3D65DRAFT_686308 [Phyllosticta citribraziliensis]|uniref:Uncharacterized protein n=1 Tax=Phyllosticta citribraziliensis TaxID=989973 RepID=A0ABR1L9Z9_9PEZI